jgi:hypothetical protein
MTTAARKMPEWTYRSLVKERKESDVLIPGSRYAPSLVQTRKYLGSRQRLRKVDPELASRRAES